MHIGGLGFINTNAPTVNNNRTEHPAAESFSMMFGSLLTEGSSDSQNATLTMDSDTQTVRDLNALLEFLKEEDILELEGGMDFLQQALSNPDLEIFSLLKEALGIEEDLSIKELLNSLFLEMGVTEEKASIDSSEHEFETEESNAVKPEMSDSGIEELMAALNQLLFMPLEEFSKAISGDMKEVLKAVKVFSLMNENLDYTSELTTLTHFLSRLTKKLESLADNGWKDQTASSAEGNQSSRMDYLQKTFTALATEINLKPVTTEGGLEGTSELPSGQTKVDAITGLIQFQQQSKPEQLTLTLHSSGRQTSSTELIRQFENMLSRSQFSNTGGTQRLFIKLMPEHLGQLRIELIQKDSALVAKILTTTASAKETLESQINGLKQAFSSQNIQVDRIEVSQQFIGQQERLFDREQQQQSPYQGQDRQNPNEQEGGTEEEEDFNVSFKEALVNMKV